METTCKQYFGPCILMGEANVAVFLHKRHGLIGVTRPYLPTGEIGQGSITQRTLAGWDQRAFASWNDLVTLLRALARNGRGVTGSYRAQAAYFPTTQCMLHGRTGSHSNPLPSSSYACWMEPQARVLGDHPLPIVPHGPSLLR